MSRLPELRPIEWAPDYYAGDDGYIYTVRRRAAFPRSKHNPYPSVVVFKEGRRLRRFVHHLIAEAFHGPRPDGLECCHGDGDPSNTRPSNLRWGTKVENAADRDAHGRTARGEKGGTSRLAESDVLAIRAEYAAGVAARVIAARFGIHRKYVNDLASGRAWAHLPLSNRKAS